MKAGIVREVSPGERRVGGTGDTVKWLKKLGFEVLVEAGAGELAGVSDATYEAAGAALSTAGDIWEQADVVLKVNPPMPHPTLGKHEADLLRDGATLISFLWPAQNADLIEKFKGRPVNVFAMDQVPRISRAQKLDALSSMANLSGYRAIIEAAAHYGRFFTGQVTAAGKLPPSKVLIIGAGVAGLAAIGAARALGAIVRAFDVRPAVRDQVKSMGADFLEVTLEEDGSGEGGYAKEMSPAFIEAEMALFAAQAKEVDIIVTTALIPGKKAPTLITKEMVRSMRRGSVVVDLAAEQGGNCEFTKPGEVVDIDGVKVIGFTDLAGRMADTASTLYGNNLCHMLDEIGGVAKWKLDLDNEIIRGAMVIHGGELIWPAPKPMLDAKPKAAAEAPKAAEEPKKPAVPKISPEEKARLAMRNKNLSLGAICALLLAIGATAPGSFLQHLEVFVLAIILGWLVIWNVTAALHTPLMSVTNAISGIIVLAGLLQISGEPTSVVTILGAVAVFIATINISGGFLVTQRMLKMFHR